jgi:hypothetical protein
MHDESRGWRQKPRQTIRRFVTTEHMCDLYAICIPIYVFFRIAALRHYVRMFRESFFSWLVVHLVLPGLSRANIFHVPLLFNSVCNLTNKFPVFWKKSIQIFLFCNQMHTFLKLFLSPFSIQDLSRIFRWVVWWSVANACYRVWLFRFIKHFSITLPYYLCKIIHILLFITTIVRPWRTFCTMLLIYNLKQ